MRKSKIIKNFSWLFFEKGLRIILGLTVGIWVVRYLGPENFSILSYAIAFTALFTVLIDLGLQQILVRELVKYKKLTNYYLGTAFVLKVTGALIAISAISLSLIINSEDPLTSIIILIIACGFIFKPTDVIDYFYQSKILSKYVVIARNSALLFTSAFQIYFILNDFSLIYFAFIQVADIIISSLILVVIYIRAGHLISQWRFSYKIAKKLIKYSWPLALNLFLITIHMKVDQIMIGNMLGSQQVGIYSAAVKLAEFWYFIPAIIVSTLLPYFVELSKKNRPLYEARLIQLYSFMFWMGIFVGVFTYFFGQFIVVTLFGEAYKDAYWALTINIWNGIWVSQAVARGIWMINENLQIYRLYNNSIIVVFNLGLNYVLIPIYGIAGAAMATLLTQSVGTWILGLFWSPLRASTLTLIKAVNPIYLLKVKKI